MADTYAAIVKPLKSGTKTIHGKVVQDGIGRITLIVTNRDGSQSLKGFTKANYVIHYYTA